MMTVERPGECAHQSVPDEVLIEGPRLAVKMWDSSYAAFLCGDCGEWLYPTEEDDSIVVYVSEPKGAGDDPWGRPDPRTHPHFWTE